MATQVGADTQLVPLELSKGQTILVRATVATDEHTEIFGHDTPPSMTKVADAIKNVGGEVMSAIHELSPSKGSIQLGFEVSGSAGIPVLSQGTAKANITVMLEWDKDTSS